MLFYSGMNFVNLTKALYMGLFRWSVALEIVPSLWAASGGQSPAPGPVLLSFHTGFANFLL